MTTKLRCASCNELLLQASNSANITIYKENLYHTPCYRDLIANDSKSDINVLCDNFPDIEQETLEALLDTNGMKETTEFLNSNWAVISEGLHEDTAEDVGIDTFDTKEEMLEWLADSIYDSSTDDWGWITAYILNKGEVVVHGDEFTVSVSF